MAHTYTCHYYHVVFSTKGRRNLIPQDNVNRLHQYLAGIINHIGGASIEVGGTTNHAHLLLSLPPAKAVAAGVNQIKSNSSKWLRSTFATMDDFAWQQGYSSFTVSRSNFPAVQTYIRRQEQHHRTMSFEQELKALLEKHGIEYDPADVSG